MRTKSNEPIELFKQCAKCNQEKLMQEFCLQSTGTRDGRGAYCYDCKRAYARAHYKNPQNKAKMIAQVIKWKKNNRARANQLHRNYRKNNVIARITHQLRKAVTKKTKLPSPLGMTYRELKKYLEPLFKDGMTWDNYGALWVMSRKKKIYEFDLTNPEEVKQINHYSNLLPTLRSEHRKSN